MKWIVAGAGVLLSIAGLYGLVTGASIIQVERGWATFIAGAVALSAGVITLAIAAFMARLEKLVAAWTGAAVLQGGADTGADADAVPPVPSVFTPVLPDVTGQPVAPREAPVFADLPPLRVEPAASSEPAPEPVIAPPAKDERPAALRDFKFVFPPVEDDKPDTEPQNKEPAPVLATPAIDDGDRVEPLKPVDTKPAARFNLGWLRRNRDEDDTAGPATAPASERFEPEPFIAPEPAPQAEPVIMPAPEPEVIAQEVESISVEIAPVEDMMGHVASGVGASPEPDSEIVQGAAKPANAAPDPFSPDWLERALAGADEPAEAAPPRFVPPSQRRAQAEAVHPAPLVEALAPAPSVEEKSAESVESPVEIGRYKANDVSYIMFSDGSITAETANGTFRFNSLIELKDFIERGA